MADTLSDIPSVSMTTAYSHNSMPPSDNSNNSRGATGSRKRKTSTPKKVLPMKNAWTTKVAEQRSATTQQMRSNSHSHHSSAQKKKRQRSHENSNTGLNSSKNKLKKKSPSSSKVKSTDSNAEEYTLVPGHHVQPRIIVHHDGGNRISSKGKASPNRSVNQLQENTVATGVQTPPKKTGANNIMNYTVRTSVSSIDLQEQIASLTEKNKKLASDLSITKDLVHTLKQQLDDSASQFTQNKKDVKERHMNASTCFKKILKQLITIEKMNIRRNLYESNHRLGQIVQQRTGPHTVIEVWKDGYRLKEVSTRQGEILAICEQLKKEQRKVTARKNTEAKRLQKANETSSHEFLNLIAQEESMKFHLRRLKEEGEALALQRKDLDTKKLVHIRELKRVRDEDRSRFKDFPVLNERYMLLRLLGKGGFSEVWLAFDLSMYLYVACKIHELNPNWSDEKKRSFTRHATREYAIHKTLKHPKIVSLYDVFEIDTNSFATVLENCQGPDLDLFLKERKRLSERDARAILIQIVSALKYMNGQKLRIIHYDLKPANILFTETGDIKITDFGLSKIMDEGCDQGMELTSQGAGTYWYLPPECFRVGGSPPRISSKVDVWSVGVIFYEMLFGKRPFGDGMSQDHMLREKTILRATSVQFPETPKCSRCAKDFLRVCLAYNQAERADVDKLSAHEYLSTRWKS